jgi:hypothetical protein
MEAISAAERGFNLDAYVEEELAQLWSLKHHPNDLRRVVRDPDDVAIDDMIEDDLNEDMPDDDLAPPAYVESPRALVEAATT